MAWGARVITSRRVWLVGLAVVVLAGLWWVVGGRTVEGVEVRVLNEPHCTGTDVTARRSPIDDTLVPVVSLEPGMECRLNLELRNDSWLPVKLHDLMLPLMGPDAGAAVRVKTVWTDDQMPIYGGVAARVPLDRWLSSDESMQVEIVYAYRHDGCTALGTLWVPAAQVGTSLLGRSATLQPTTKVWFAGTSASTC